MAQDYKPPKQLAADVTRMAMEFAHCYSFVGDDTMPLKKAELEAAISALLDATERAERRAIMFGDVIESHTHAMQAAVIEEIAGAGSEEAMQWIRNTLIGPGHCPDVDAANALPTAAKVGPAQAWFDMQEERHAAFREANPGPARRTLTDGGTDDRP